MICPVDMSLREAADPRITGIPDIVLNKLISQLAEEKGNNIVRSLPAILRSKPPHYDRLLFWTAVILQTKPMMFPSRPTFAA
jgi:hypothetical protein